MSFTLSLILGVSYPLQPFLSEVISVTFLNYEI